MSFNDHDELSQILLKVCQQERAECVCLATGSILPHREEFLRRKGVGFVYTRGAG